MYLVQNINWNLLKLIEMESAESGFDKENDFCHFIEFLFEEDVMMQFSPTTVALHVFCYYNDQTFDSFKHGRF